MGVPAADAEKIAAAREAARLVDSGMAVGLGSGSTVNWLIAVLAASAPDAAFVGASPATEHAARTSGLHVVHLDDVGELNLTIDGADQIDPHGWLIKGGGAAHTREKILAVAARRFVVIASSDKRVRSLRPPVPIEVLPFAPETTLAALGSARRRFCTPPSPDGGVIADFYGLVDEPAETPRRLERLPGIVEHGLFPPELVDLLIVGRPDGATDTFRRPKFR
jgi:ribose 5-phosphate isomerase A